MKITYQSKAYTPFQFCALKTDKEWLLEIIQFLRFWLDENQENITISTSGSTGKPKPILVTKASLKKSALITADYFHLRANQTAFLCLPVKFIAGKMMVVRAFVGDMDLIIVEPISNPLQSFYQQIDFSAMTPLQVEAVLANNSEKLNLIKTLLIGGGAVSKILSKKLQNFDCHCVQTYGMTETITHIALQDLNGTTKSEYFQVLPGFEIDIDERGCLIISADHIYQKKVVTNDLVEILSNNSFIWLGRFDNVINTGGIKVYPENIESKINSLITSPFFVIGTPDEKLGQKVTLCIETSPMDVSDQKILLNQIKSRLSKFEIPRSILFFECFIYTTTGKIQRAQTLANH